MSALIFVTWNAEKDAPLANLIIDEELRFDLALFDYTGSLQEPSHILVNNVSCSIYSKTTEGKGEIIKHLANGLISSDNRYVGIIDDDIIIRVSDLNRALEIGERGGYASFQPSLARCSYYSHGFTLNHQNSTAREVCWVEIMMPIIKSELLLLAKPFLDLSISSWGFDCYVLPMLAFTEKIEGGHAVIDASIAAHIRPITSGNKIYRNGLTAEQEMLRVKHACKKYMVSIGINWEEDDLLHELFSF